MRFIRTQMMVVGLVSIVAGASAYAQQIYWTEFDTGLVRRADSDGSNIETLFDTGGSLPNNAVDTVASKLYVTVIDPDEILRANLDGTAVEVLLDASDGVDSPGGITLDSGTGLLCWSNILQNCVVCWNIDGANPPTVIWCPPDVPPGGVSHVALDVDAGHVYWTAAHRQPPGVFNGIIRANLDGSGIPEVVVQTTNSQGLVLDLMSGFAYWADFHGGRIGRVRLDGTEADPDFVTGLLAPSNLDIDTSAGHLYWAEANTFGVSRIGRVNLDGSGQVILLEAPDVSGPFGIAFVPGASGPPIPTVSQWGMIAMTLLLLAAGTIVFRYRFKQGLCRAPAW